MALLRGLVTLPPKTSQHIMQPWSQNTAERDENFTTLTKDVRDAAGPLQDNTQDQNLTLIHKQDQGAMAATLLMNKIF